MEALRIPWRPLGRLLLEKGLVTEGELDRALAEQERTGVRLGEIVVALGLVSHTAVTSTLAEQYGAELQMERGFGTGLRSEIDRRHRSERHVRLLPDPVPVLPAQPPAPADPRLVELGLDGLEPTRQVELLLDLLEERSAEPAEPVAEPQPEPVSGHVLFVPGPSGYLLAALDGPAPDLGTELEVAGETGPFLVTRLGRSPLPGDGRRCAYLERAESAASRVPADSVQQ